MLQKIRDKTTGVIAFLFLGLIAVVFVFWGIDFGSSANTYAVEVNGETVPAQTVQRAWQQRLSQIHQMLRDEVPPELLSAQQSAMLDQFAQQTLLRQRAEKFGYQVSDEALAERVREIPQFHADGQFSVDRYNAILRSAGLSPAQFEADLRAELLITQVQEAVVDSGFVLPYELDRRYLLERQEREVDYALIAANSFANQVQVTDEQIQAWYDAHTADYMSPETVDLAYLEVTREAAEARVEVSEQALKDYYETVKDRFETQERRHASHILITTEDGLDEAAAEKKAAELAAQAQSGANFEDLAKQHSKDPGSAQQGGDLGWAERGMFVGPFEDTLFAMSKGDIRGPVKTQFGFHVIRLEDIDAGHRKSFEEAREELEAEYRRERSDAIFTEAWQQLDEQAFAALTELESVATALDLPLKTVEGFTREGGGELGSDPGLIETAFSEDVLERGQNSPLIPIGDDRAVIVRMTDHQPAQARPLAEVRSQIEELLKRQAMFDAATKQGEEVLARLQAGETWTSVMSDLNLQPAGRRYVTRRDSLAPGAVLRQAFDVPRAQISAETPYLAGTTTDDGNYAVWLVAAVRAPDLSAEAAQEKAARTAQTARQIGNEEFATYLDEAQRTADIVKNPRIFD